MAVSTRVSCGNVAVENSGLEDSEVYIKLPVGVDLVIMSLKDMVPSGSMTENAAELNGKRREENLKAIETLDCILEAGRGQFGHVVGNSDMIDPGSYAVEVADSQAVIRVARECDEGRGSSVLIKLNRRDTRCLLLALRRFAKLWSHGEMATMKLVHLKAQRCTTSIDINCDEEICDGY